VKQYLVKAKPFATVFFLVQVRQISVGKLLAQAIKCIHTGDSVKRLFDMNEGVNLLA